MSDYLKEKIEDARKAGQQPGRTPTAAPSPQYSSGTNELKSVGPADCAEHMLLQARQKDQSRWTNIYAAQLEHFATYCFVRAIPSPTTQAQAGETNTDAEPSRCKNPVARGESTETDALTGDAPVASVSTLHAVAQAEQQRGKPVAWAVFEDNGNIRMWSTVNLDVEEFAARIGKVVTPLYASPPAPLPAGEVTLNEDQAYHLFLIADTAARNERGKNKAVNHLRELLLPAYRAWHDANPGTAHPALAIPSTDRGGGK